MTYTSQLIGRFGNQMFQYAALRAEAERDGVPFVTPAWIGDELFDLPKHAINGEVKTLPGYRQDQASLIYTRSQARKWFKLRPEIAERLPFMAGGLVAHRRVGDYLQLGYPVVSLESYRTAVDAAGLPWNKAHRVCEETPGEALPGLPEWLTDFARMMFSAVLFRGNSTFSWWAAALSDAEVWSPVVDGLGAGVHDVKFVRGNHPRFCSLPFVTDLYLAE